MHTILFFRFFALNEPNGKLVYVEFSVMLPSDVPFDHNKDQVTIRFSDPIGWNTMAYSLTYVGMFPGE